MLRRSPGLRILAGIRVVHATQPQTKAGDTRTNSASVFRGNPALKQPRCSRWCPCVATQPPGLRIIAGVPVLYATTPRLPAAEEGQETPNYPRSYLLSSSRADTLDRASPSRASSFSILVMRCFNFSCVLLKSERRRAKRVDRLSRVDSRRSSFWSIVTFFSISWRTASCNNAADRQLVS